MSDRETLDVYDEKAAEYADMTHEDMVKNTELTAFIAALPTSGRALDLGCGPGSAAEIMARAGLRVDAVDASAEMVRLAAERPGVAARQGTFDTLAELPERGLDGIWASFSLLHAPREDLPRHLADCHRALRPGGVITIGMKTGTGTHRDKLGRRYTYVTIKELETLLTHAGFTVGSHVTGSGPGLSGEPAPWVVMTANA